MDTLSFPSQVDADRYVLQQRISKLEEEQNRFWIFNFNHHLQEQQKQQQRLLTCLRQQLVHLDSPIYKLPDVILADIFVLCIRSLEDAYPDGVASASDLCRRMICSSVARFRRIACQTPALWTHFSATLYNFGCPLFSMSTNPRLAMQLDRAGGRPLTFTLHIDELQNSSHLWDHFYYMSAMDYEEGAYCRVLEPETIRQIYLKAHTFHLRGALDDNRIPMPVSFYGTPLTTLLTKLHLTTVAFPSLSHFLELLSSTPSLEHITLTGVSWQLKDLPRQISSLSRLQYLEIDIDPQVPNTLLKFLNIANCRTLLLRGTLAVFDNITGDTSFLADVPTAHVRSIQQLAVLP